MERLLVTPLSRTAMLVGRTLKETLVFLVQTVLIIAFAVPLGFDLHLGGAVMGVLLLVVLGVGLGSLSFVLAIKSAPNGTLFYILTQTLLYPLLLLSGVLLPLESGPGWLRVVGAFNPLSHIVDASRALFTGRVWESSVAYGGAVALAIAMIGLVLGNRAMRKGV
ncbi:ABC transporter permease [Thermoactinospora rubra]|uniref:ABC transporter permease n=1 Tax=Thermoactinospora rubra TaxID=1088767 RepID=UPI000A0F9B88|nr:ABC transporter permease [Thermoactinospora rubra]